MRSVLLSLSNDSPVHSVIAAMCLVLSVSLQIIAIVKFPNTGWFCYSVFGAVLLTVAVLTTLAGVRKEPIHHLLLSGNVQTRFSYEVQNDSIGLYEFGEQKLFDRQKDYVVSEYVFTFPKCYSEQEAADLLDSLTGDIHQEALSFMDNVSSSNAVVIDSWTFLRKDGSPEIHVLMEGDKQIQRNKFMDREE